MCVNRYLNWVKMIMLENKCIIIIFCKSDFRILCIISTHRLITAMTSLSSTQITRQEGAHRHLADRDMEGRSSRILLLGFLAPSCGCSSPPRLAYGTLGTWEDSSSRNGLQAIWKVRACASPSSLISQQIIISHLWRHNSS